MSEIPLRFFVTSTGKPLGTTYRLGRNILVGHKEPHKPVTRFVKSLLLTLVCTDRFMYGQAAHQERTLRQSVLKNWNTNVEPMKNDNEIT